jgi:hypothetical protein
MALTFWRPLSAARYRRRRISRPTPTFTTPTRARARQPDPRRSKALGNGAVEGALRPPLSTATQSALHDPTILLGLRRPKIGARLTDPSRRNIIAPIRGSERCVAGIKSESVAGFLLELGQLRRNPQRDLERPLHYTKRARQTDPSRSELCSRSLRFLCAEPRALATCHVKPTLTLVRGLDTKQGSRRKRTSRPSHASNLAHDPSCFP